MKAKIIIKSCAGETSAELSCEPVTRPGAQDQKKNRPTKTLPPYAVIAAIALAFVLTACGARIDTTMNVSNTGGGERIMVLNLDESDVSKLTGGTAAAEASIRRHLPGSLAFSGLKPASGGGVTATLTLAFASTSDYKKKAEDLLKTGGTGQPNIDFSVSDSTLVKGITLREANTSADLLQWMFKGLIADGVVSSGDSSNMYELGTSKLTFNGSTTSESNTFNVKNVKNNGFDAVTMQTQIQDATHITRTVTYSADKARYAAGKDVLEKFISESAPDGAMVARPTPGTWAVTFSGDPASITSATGKALGGGAATFSLSLAAASDDPSEKILTITDTASCDAVCATSKRIIDTVSSASGYTPDKTDVDTSAQAPVSFRYAPPFNSVSSAFKFGIDGSVDANVEFVLPKTSIDVAGDGFAKLLTPDDGVGSLRTDQNESSTTYTVTINGKNPEDFAAKYARWAPGASFTAVGSSNLFLQETGYTISPALESLTGRHHVTDGATSKVSLPFGQWVTNAGGGIQEGFALGGASVTADGLGSRLTVQTTGLTTAGLVGVAALLAALAIAIFFLVRHRGTIIVRLRTVRGRVEGALAKQRVLQFEVDALPHHANHPGGMSLFNLGTPEIHRGGPRSPLDMPMAQPRLKARNSVLDIPASRVAAGQGTSLFDLQRDTASDTRPSLLS